MRVSLPRLPNALRPKRRWLQYSLRTLLLLMTAVAVWMGWYVHRARVQKLQRLKNLGIQHTQVTAEGIHSFTSALPACRIVN